MVEKQDVYMGAIQVAQVMCEQIKPTSFTAEQINSGKEAAKVAKFALDIATKIAEGLDAWEEPG